jgi:hypothetical protein
VATDVQSVGLRLLLEHISSPGETAETRFDEAVTYKGTDGVADVTAKRRMRLPADADDEELLFTDAALIVIWSRNGVGFKVRLDTDETLSGALTLFTLGSTGAGVAALSGKVLLTGLGANQADLEIWIVEKTA